MLTKSQEYAYAVMMCGYNTFLTGGAGTGKTFILNKFIKDRQEQGYNVMVTAPTGIAAANVDGITLHSALNIPSEVIVDDIDNYETLEKLVAADIFVIEEISMCRVDVFDFTMKQVLKANKRRRAYKLPSIQLVFCGDFFQLAPVVTGKDRYALNKHYKHDIGAGYCFYSKFWDMLDLKYVYLNEVVRQNDTEFMKNLTKLRNGRKDVIKYFTDNTSNHYIDGAIALCGLNKDADEINHNSVDNIDGESQIYRMRFNGVNLDNETPAPEILELKVGVRVMALTNHKNNGQYKYINGSLGTVRLMDENSITVDFDNGNTEIIERNTWDVKEYQLIGDKLELKTIGSIEQFPLRIAYAITIHKSQGQTYDAVNLSPYSWDCGQLYVALSRVRYIKNMYLKYAIHKEDIVTSLNVIKFYNYMISKSNNSIDLNVNLIQKKQQKLESEQEVLLSLLSNGGQ